MTGQSPGIKSAPSYTNRVGHADTSPLRDVTAKALKGKFAAKLDQFQFTLGKCCTDGSQFLAFAEDFLFFRLQPPVSRGHSGSVGDSRGSKGLRSRA